MREPASGSPSSGPCWTRSGAEAAASVPSSASASTSMSAPERKEPRLPDRYAVLGHPILHSLSPRIHAMFAQQTGQRLSYAALDVAPEQLAVTVRDFFAEGGCGLNITVPHKQAVTRLLDGLTER